MTVNLYQLGDVAFHFHQESAEYSHDGSGKTERSKLGFTNLWQDSRYRISPRRVNLKGVLLPYCGTTPEWTARRLAQLVDVPIDILGYGYQFDCNDGCACNKRTLLQLVWLQNRGVISDFREKVIGDLIECNITVLFDTFWSPLDRFIWNFTDNFPSPHVQSVMQDDFYPNIRPYPDLETIFEMQGSSNYIFDKRRYEDAEIWRYNDMFWDMFHNYHAPGYPETGRHFSWVENHSSAMVYAATEYWNAPPLSIYQIKMLDGVSQVSINVERLTTPFNSEVFETSIDIDRLNDNLIALGYNTLSNEDRLIVGDVLRRPGFIIREDGTFQYPGIPVTYSGNWPGMLEGGQNFVRWYGNGAWMSQLHIFRRM